jgi:hypothetical protein
VDDRTIFKSADISGHTTYHFVPTISQTHLTGKTRQSNSYRACKARKLLREVSVSACDTIIVVMNYSGYATVGDGNGFTAVPSSSPASRATPKSWYVLAAAAFCQ